MDPELCYFLVFFYARVFRSEIAVCNNCGYEAGGFQSIVWKFSCWYGKISGTDARHGLVHYSVVQRRSATTYCPESPNADQQAAYDTKMEEQAVLIKQRKEIWNTVRSHLTQKQFFDVLKCQLRSNTWLWQ